MYIFKLEALALYAEAHTDLRKIRIVLRGFRLFNFYQHSISYY